MRTVSETDLHNAIVFSRMDVYKRMLHFAYITLLLLFFIPHTSGSLHILTLQLFIQTTTSPTTLRITRLLWKHLHSHSSTPRKSHTNFTMAPSDIHRFLQPGLVTMIEADLKPVKHFRGYYPNSREAYASYLPFKRTFGSKTYEIATMRVEFADPVRSIIHERLDQARLRYGRNADRDTDGDKEDFRDQGPCKHGLPMAWDVDSELNGDDCAKCGRLREEIWHLKKLEWDIYCWKVEMETGRRI